MSRMTENYKRTTISLNTEEYEILRFLAFKQKTSVAAVIRGLITSFIEDEEDIRDAMKALSDKNGTLDWQTFKKEQLGL
jgi:predicted DNA-binding protein